MIYKLFVLFTTYKLLYCSLISVLASSPNGHLVKIRDFEIDWKRKFYFDFFAFGIVALKINPYRESITGTDVNCN
jgi:hypothetical protein